MDDHGPLKKIMGKIMRKNRQNCRKFFEKSSLEFFLGMSIVKLDCPFIKALIRGELSDI